MPYQRIVFEMTWATFWKRKKEHSDYSGYGMISSKAAVGAAVTEHVSVHRGRKLSVGVCKIDSVFLSSHKAQRANLGLHSRVLSQLQILHVAAVGFGVIPLWPPWAGANTQLELGRFGFDCPSTWGDRQWLTGRLPQGTAILPSPPMSQSLCTFLDGGQRETSSLTGYKSGGGSRQDRCGKAAVCVPSMQPFRIKLFLQKQRVQEFSLHTTYVAMHNI